MRFFSIVLAVATLSSVLASCAPHAISCQAGEAKGFYRIDSFGHVLTPCLPCSGEHNEACE